MIFRIDFINILLFNDTIGVTSDNIMDNAANNTVVLITVTDFGITLPCGLPQLYYVRTYINRISNKALIFCEESCSLNFPDLW